MGEGRGGISHFEWLLRSFSKTMHIQKFLTIAPESHEVVFGLNHRRMLFSSA